MAVAIMTGQMEATSVFGRAAKIQVERCHWAIGIFSDDSGATGKFREVWLALLEEGVSSLLSLFGHIVKHGSVAR